jgi:hypothetical protein
VLSQVEFLDVFDRADGPVGSQWTSLPQTPGLTIFHNAVCASEQVTLFGDAPPFLLYGCLLCYSFGCTR